MNTETAIETAELALNVRIDMFSAASRATKVREELIALLIENPDHVHVLSEDFRAGHIAAKCVNQSMRLEDRRIEGLRILGLSNRPAKAGREDDLGPDYRTAKQQDAYNSAKTAWSSIVRAADVKPADTRGGHNRGQKEDKSADPGHSLIPATPTLANAAEIYGYFAIQGKAMAAVLQKHAGITLDVRLANIVHDLNARVAEILLDPSKVDPSH